MGTVLKRTGLMAAAAVAVAALGLNSASAADLLVEPPIIEAPEPVAKGGWYLRGDITYDIRSSDGGTYYDATAIPNATTGLSDFAGRGVGMFNGVDMEDSYDVSLGIGYQITDYLRADLTGEYVFASKWSGSTINSDRVCAGLQTAGGGSTTNGTEQGTCNTDESADVSMFKVLGNAYVDLGTFGGITPYIGAGIGGAYVMYDDFSAEVRSSQCCQVGTTNQIDFGPSTVDRNGLSSWRFAYALHAGASFDVTHNMKLDVGYTYSHVTGGAMADANGIGKPTYYDDGFTDHVVRAGVRYSLW